MISGENQKRLQDKINAAKNDPAKRERAQKIIAEAEKEYGEKWASSRIPICGSGVEGHVYGKLLAAGLVTND